LHVGEDGPAAGAEQANAACPCGTPPCGQPSNGVTAARIHAAKSSRGIPPLATRRTMFTTSGSGASISKPFRIRKTFVATKAMRLLPSRKAWFFASPNPYSAASSAMSASGSYLESDDQKGIERHFFNTDCLPEMSPGKLLRRINIPHTIRIDNMACRKQRKFKDQRNQQQKYQRPFISSPCPNASKPLYKKIHNYFHLLSRF
jgi:hypothetical protein